MSRCEYLTETVGDKALWFLMIYFNTVVFSLIYEENFNKIVLYKSCTNGSLSSSQSWYFALIISQMLSDVTNSLRLKKLTDCGTILLTEKVLLIMRFFAAVRFREGALYSFPLRKSWLFQSHIILVQEVQHHGRFQS